MSVNRERPHIFVLPEDRANQELATGFHLGVDRIRQMQVLQPAHGWQHVLDLFKSDHIAEMEKYPTRFMVLLIDFDGDENRLEAVKDGIPEHLAGRVFILGTLSEPEDLKRANLGFYEDIGKKLAEECREETYTTSGWEHNLLRHNASELERLSAHVRRILFQSI